MDETDDLTREASAWVAHQIAGLRRLSYDNLLGYLNKPAHEEMTASSGQTLIRETQVFWDGRRNGPLRVIVDVWQPHSDSERRWRRVKRSIAIDDFIRAPDGSFVGERAPGDPEPGE